MGSTCENVYYLQYTHIMDIDVPLGKAFQYVIVGK
jgi:hypothetical protein